MTGTSAPENVITSSISELAINDIKDMTDSDLGKSLAVHLGFRLLEASEFTSDPMGIMFEIPDSDCSDFAYNICKKINIIAEIEQKVINLVGGANLTVSLMESAVGSGAFTTAKGHRYIRSEAVYLMSFANARLRAEACLLALKPRLEDMPKIKTLIVSADKRSEIEPENKNRLTENERNACRLVRKKLSSPTQYFSVLEMFPAIKRGRYVFDSLESKGVLDSSWEIDEREKHYRFTDHAKEILNEKW